MIILAIDSTAVVASCAICQNEKLLSLFTVNNGNTHSETLLPMIEESLKRLSLTVDNIDLFALSEGPGSFTGVRIGTATIKGLAFGKDKPCVGVSTLEALAYNLSMSDGIICPCMNARRNQVYNAVFKNEAGKITRLTEDRAISVTQLEDELCGYDLPIYLCGDGDFLLYESDSRKKDYAYVNELLRHQNGYSVARTALAKYSLGKSTTDLAIAPTYLRPSQAERTRNEQIKGDFTK
ncbi:MAG: tRNA (adenosine(37)-N6)-threonylcarbamoyltransferase complex dimerization subunit type 1 TsaB [Clostridia bacterium]|nr:tRNA (adenosine(37)-N6)-threonylcarbamoyltransferase complex dimerization subunit type 1 TsaB [Clostridia bacterium]